MSLYSSNPNPEYGFLIVADHGKVIVATHWLRDTTLDAIDALRRDCNTVTIRALASQADSRWEIELTGVSDSSFSYSTRGVTIDEAARRLARWRGIDITE